MLITEKRTYRKKRIGWTFKESKLNTFQRDLLCRCVSYSKRKSLIKLCCVLYSPGSTANLVYFFLDFFFLLSNGDAVMYVRSVILTLYHVYFVFLCILFQCIVVVAVVSTPRKCVSNTFQMMSPHAFIDWIAYNETKIGSVFNQAFEIC